MPKLNKRLSCLADRIAPCETLCDIGCDHGKLSVYAAAKGLAKRVIAADISTASLKKASDLAARTGAGNIDFRLGNGLDVIAEGEADIAVIAGMGGIAIADIIKNGLDKKIKRFLLCPHSKQEHLCLSLKSFEILTLCDIIIYDGGKFYRIIEAKPKNYCEASELKKHNEKIEKADKLYGKNAGGLADRYGIDSIITGNDDFNKYIKQRAKFLTSACSNSEKLTIQLDELKAIADVIK